MGWPGVGVPDPNGLVVAAVAMRCPSGLYATLLTTSSWPRRGAPMGWPVSASQIRTVLSSLAVAMRCPSGL